MFFDPPLCFVLSACHLFLKLLCHFVSLFGEKLCLCTVFLWRHDILFAHSPLELGPRNVNGQYLLPRDLHLKCKLPIGSRRQFFWPSLLAAALVLVLVAMIQAWVSMPEASAIIAELKYLLDTSTCIVKKQRAGIRGRSSARSARCGWERPASMGCGCMTGSSCVPTPRAWSPAR